MINRIVLVGRITKDLELKNTTNGLSLTHFTLAVNRNFSNSNGEREADFINCVAWRKSAENLAKFANKGSMIGIEGRIQTRNYENQQKQRVYITEVVVDNFSFLDSKTANKNVDNSVDNNHTVDKNTGVNSFIENSIDISDDDLPF